MDKRILVAIESPYAGNIEENTKFAQKCCRFAFEQGYNPFAMHLFFPQFLNEHAPEERAAGIQCGLAWTLLAEEHWYCLREGENLSKGMILSFNKYSDKAKILRFTSDGVFLKYDNSYEDAAMIFKI